MDFNNLTGSYPTELIKFINEKELDYVVAVNKIDSIYKSVNLGLLKNKVFNLLKKNHP